MMKQRNNNIKEAVKMKLKELSWNVVEMLIIFLFNEYYD